MRENQVPGGALSSTLLFLFLCRAPPPSSSCSSPSTSWQRRQTHLLQMRYLLGPAPPARTPSAGPTGSSRARSGGRGRRRTLGREKSLCCHLSFCNNDVNLCPKDKRTFHIVNATKLRHTTKNPAVTQDMCLIEISTISEKET